MKSLTYSIILLAFTAVSTFAQAQPTGPAAGKRSPGIVGEVERAGAQLQVVLTNSSETSAFQGAAKVSVGLSEDTAVQLTINLGPNETRRFPLSIPGPSEKSRAQYSLAVYNQTGSLVMFKIAPLSVTDSGLRETALSQPPAPMKNSAEVTVSAKLTRNMPNKDAETATSDQDEPPILTFEIESATPVKDAVFTLSAKDFQRREQVSIDGRTAIEFRLSEILSERKLSYKLASATGQTLASGEVDLDQLPASDSVSISALIFDRPAICPTCPIHSIASFRASRADLGNFL